MMNDLIILTHGQVVSMFHIIKKNWSHYFNRKEVKNSNLQTKFIARYTDQIQQMLETEKLLGDKKETAEDFTFQISVGEHCFFNRKDQEVTSVEFLPVKSNCFYEFLLV